MNIITVIPLTRSKVPETLSYFTSSEVPIGAIVSVPMRSKTISSIVAESRIAQDLKTEIKSATYEIRKLGKLKAAAFFPAPFMEACKKLAHYYIGNTGAVIDILTSDSLTDSMHKIEAPGTPQGSALSRRLSLDAATYAVQGDDDDRMSSWRSLIRQEFARKKSVAFYVPTIEDVESIAAKLTKGIEGYIFLLHGSLTKKKIIDTWKAVARMEHPVVVIATASFSLLPRTDMDTIIIERENSRGWMSPKAPYPDLRHALETIAHLNGQVVYRADSMLRIETLRRLNDNEISQGSPFKWRSISLADDTLINMTQSPREITANKRIDFEGVEKEHVADEKPKFRIISPELGDLIEQNRNESTHLFIYTARRGISPVTACDDCGAIVSSERCSAPMVLHASRDGGHNFFMCHICGERRNADENCRVCGGWRLSTVGIGIERVETEIREKFKHVDLFKIDSDSTPTDKDIREVIQKFKARPGSVLIGTELALAHIREAVDHTAIASLDSLFALPDFRIPEKIMYTLVRLRTLSTKSILVQTRRPQEKIFEYGLKGNLNDFYRGTIEERKYFNYPPWKTLIKVTIEGKKDPIARAMSNIKKIIEPHEMDIFPAFTGTARGSSTIHGLIRVDPHQWPDSNLIAKLRSLPPSVSVRVDPESLL